LIRNAWLILAALLVVVDRRDAFAYRPFDGTDAAVAEPGAFEIELGPSQYLEQGAERSFAAPAVVLNYGFTERWEFVLQGSFVHSLDRDAATSSLLDNAALFKTVLREGSLQDKPGPSIATEFGFLLPGSGGEPGTGFSAAALVSQRWSTLTVHFNAQASLTREQHADLGFSTIVEGPHDWRIRPVAELFYERDFGGSETGSALVGAIWQVRDDVALDLGLRAGWIDNQPLKEVRAGVTFAFDGFPHRRASSR
jgi:hypothetical protein